MSASPESDRREVEMEENQNLNNPTVEGSIAPQQPQPPQKPKLKPLILIGIIITLLVAGVASAYFLVLNKQPQQIACTMEAKICPDGSSVGRTGPKCEFSPCPTPNTQSANQINSQSKTEANNTGIWDPICEKEEFKNSTFKIKVSFGEGLTQVARGAVNWYVTLFDLLHAPVGAPNLSSEERIYAEDYTRKQLPQTPPKSGEIIQVSCDLVENSVLKARLLTISQKENLKQFSNKVNSLKIRQLIEDIIDSTIDTGQLKPIIIIP